MKRRFTLCGVLRIALPALLCLCAQHIMAQFSGSGSGTESDPYRIFNAVQLNQVRNFLNKSNVYFSLEADIDLTEWIAENNPVQGWSPIGSSLGNSFRGTFNGNGHTISGLWIKRTDTDYVGLFGYVYNATVSDVRLYGAEIEGHDNVGGISGYFECYNVSRSFSGCSVEKGSIKGNDNVGGISGYSYSKNESPTTSSALSFAGCSSECSIKGRDNVGGIAGYSYSKNESTNYRLTSTLSFTECFSECSIEGNDNIGGIAGCAFSSSSYSSTLSFTECVSEYSIDGRDNVGGIVGYGVFDDYGRDSITITRCSSNADIRGSGSVGGIAGNVRKDYNGNCIIFDSYSTGSIAGERSLGGITGRHDDSGCTIARCFSRHTAIVGNDYVAGIINGGSVSKSAAINEEIVADGNLARVANGSTCSNNLAWVLTSMVLDGEKQPIPPDDGPNGTSTGLSTLKLQATYEGMGWDFTTTWAIQETESFPYLQIQTAPPHFTQSLKAGDTRLSGQCVEEGTVRVRVGDSLYTVQSEGNSWSVTVGALRAGDVVSVSVQAEDKMPSYPVYATVKLAGSGTEDDPYLVGTASDLQAVTEMEEEDAHYLMTNDIDLTEWIEEQNSGGGWIPVGGNNNAFTGTFDGGGHTVSGLWANAGSWNNGGLFAICASGGTIRNLNVETVSGKTVYGAEYSGGIAGRNAGTIEECTVRGDVSGNYAGGITGKNTGMIEQCTINGTVSGSEYAGGIVGSNSGSVSNCRFVGDVSSSASSSYAGGIAGWNEGTVTVCKAEGSVSSDAQSARVGGIVGYNSGSTSEVSDCESLMAVEASGSSAYGGGVAGYNYGNVIRCLATGDVTGYSVAGICGYNYGADARVTACVAANRSITATKGGLRVLGGYSSGGQAPGMEENYALKTMSVSVNGVPQVIYDDPLNSTAKTEDVLKQTALYERMSWSMDDIWGIDESNSFPYLRTHVVMVSKVDIDMDDAVMEVGDNVQFTATVLPEDARNSTVKWSSSKPEVAEVTEDGKVKALSAGTAVIKAVAADGSGASDSCRVTVNPKKAEKVTIDRSEVVIEIASVCKLNATVEPEYTADRSVTWESSDSRVATVDAEGTVTAVSVGTATVTATTNDGTGLFASCAITVIPKRVKSISLDCEEITLKRGTSERLTVTVLPEDAGDRSVTWTSSDERIVTVDTEGVVTAVSAGTATVTATTNDGTNLTASCVVSVTPKLAESISLNRDELTLERGASECLTATVLPSDADNRSVTWASSDEDVATVDAGGIVTAISAGTATVTATTNDGTNLTASCVVTVTPKLAESISLDREELILERGASECLTATVYPATADDRSVTWTSSDERVVTVDSEGVVTAVSAGTATVTATTNDGTDLTASCAVTVTPEYVRSISLDREELTLERGASERLTATVYPATADDRSVTWTSSDERVVTVDTEGVATAVSAGTATVTATTNDGTDLTASCVVTVTPKLAESISLDREELILERGASERLTATVYPATADE